MGSANIKVHDFVDMVSFRNELRLTLPLLFFVIQDLSFAAKTLVKYSELRKLQFQLMLQVFNGNAIRLFKFF